MDLHRSNKALVKRVETLLQKTLIGCVLVILPTGSNLAAICILVGKELAFICLTLCTFDVTWAAIVFHWLTIVGTDENEGATPAPQSRKSGSQQPGISLQPQTEPLRKKPTLLTPTDLDLLSIDAKDDGGTKTTNKFDFGLSQTATPLHCGPSSQTESHWRDSGHSTLVSDANMSNNAVNPR
ncbi:hypothetical protein AA0113_g12213 [Alternaria arborescens]|uniref:Uncharacterized protein n=1 Tax=Alternaria arborescens TaxID=156630 RepID=A0A4Q4PYB8_9PLEO|nr:hypothetical protein AA0113_g12213 [Alternaria arborescens]